MLERSRILKRVDEAPGARVIEGYPIEPRGPRMPAVLPGRPGLDLSASWLRGGAAAVTQEQLPSGR